MNDLSPRDAERVRSIVDWTLLIGLGVAIVGELAGLSFAAAVVGFAFSLCVFEGTLFLMTLR